MPFWSRKKAGLVKKKLKAVEKKLKTIKHRPRQLKWLNETLGTILGSLEEVKEEIQERAAYEIGNPLIDQRFDASIQSLADAEIERVDKLESDLGIYKGFLAEDHTEEDLKDIIVVLNESASELEKADKSAEDSLAAWEATTYAERTRQTKASVTVPPLKTWDGITWKRIAKVARLLGGTIIKEEGGRHNYFIRFGGRRIPFSQDVRSNLIANEISNLMRGVFPAHKVLNTSELRNSFRAGTVKRAA